jgi:hypothetical protein
VRSLKELGIFNNGTLVGTGSSNAVGGGLTQVNTTDNATLTTSIASGQGNTDVTADGSSTVKSNGTTSGSSTTQSETITRSYTSTLETAGVHTVGNGTRAYSHGNGFGTATSHGQTQSKAGGTSMSALTGSYADGQSDGTLSVDSPSGVNGTTGKAIGVGGGDSWSKILGLLRDGRLPGV